MRIPVVLLILLFSLNSFSQGGTFAALKKTPSPATTLPKQPSKKKIQENRK